MGVSMLNPVSGKVEWVSDDEIGGHATSKGYTPVGNAEAGNIITAPEDNNKGIVRRHQSGC